ncbi:MAG: hypothetical protein E6R06_25950 [Mycobacterium sp.]|nr:MAG: hypothetical protein E6R06_25950 [Mycobacterium sp.]
MALPVYYGPKGTPPPPGPKYAKPSPKAPQGEQRDRRRGQLALHYGQGFSLTQEIADICTPLAAKVAAAPEPTPCRCRDDVQALAGAVHELVGTVVGWLAEAQAQKKAANVAPGARERSIRLMVDLAERPRLPEITDDALHSGAWATALVEMARPYSEPLAKHLGRAKPPGVAEPNRSASELLEAALREVDHAALELQTRLKWNAVCAEEYQHVLAARADRDPKAQARAELAQMGIDA